ncbi:MAG: ABC-2 family transporter protein [Pseudobdellovibrionaceae bacterium]
MFSLFFKAIRNNWSAQASNKANLCSAIVTMIVNNVLFLYGMWLMLFDGKEQNKALWPYYLTMTVLAYIGWGAVNFFTGGLKVMGEIIDNGRLEPMLGTPREPLFLLAISESSATALGDLLQGLITLALLAWVSDMHWVLRAAFCSVIVTVNFATVFIAAGTLTFFMNRGASLSQFIIESTLSFTMYPMTKVLGVQSRWILYLIPAALTATLPMNWIENASVVSFVMMFLASAVCLLLSIQFFKLGVRSYRAASYLGPR